MAKVLPNERLPSSPVQISGCLHVPIQISRYKLFYLHLELERSPTQCKCVFATNKMPLYNLLVTHPRLSSSAVMFD